MTDYLNKLQSVIIGTPLNLYTGVDPPVPILGNTPGITDPDSGKIFRVYNNNTIGNNGVVASFQATGQLSLLELVRHYGNQNSSKDILQFGLFDNTPNTAYSGTTFAFMDGETQKPYLSFQTIFKNIKNDNY